MPRTAPTNLPAARKAIFGLVATVIFFALLELVLLAVGVKPVLYAEDPFVGFSSRVPLFVEERGDDGAFRWVTARNKQQFFNPQEFARDKGDDAYRVFCVGGSTTYGRPYDDTTSFCGWLRELLPVGNPRDWEVINAGGISYASYRVALLMEELIRHEPDLFVVYSGHNEFLERRTYAGMRETPGIVRGLVGWLGHSRTFSVVQRAIRPSAPTASGAAPTGDLLPGEVDTLLDNSIGPEAYHRDDEVRDKVLAHYRFNLARIVDIGRSVGAEVLLATPASNLRDASPFKSEHRAGLAEAERLDWEREMESARTALDTGRRDEALASLDAAVRIDDRHADTHYLLGRTLLELGRYAEAREAFVQARDDDICPLRALTPMQGIVEEVATQRGVPWIDFSRRVDELSEHGIPGRQLFMDHVHPTIDGNRGLAVTILEELIALGIVRPGPEWGEDAVRRVALEVEGRLDRAAHGIALRNLANVLSWAGKQEEAARLARQAAELAPEDATAENQLGVVLTEQGDTRAAEEHLRRALEIDPGLAQAHLNLGVILEGRNDPAAAEEHYRRAVELQPDYVQALNNLAIVLIGTGRLEEAERTLERALQSNPDHVRARCNLAHVLLRRGEMDAAAGHLEHALRFDPDSAEAHNNLGILHIQQRRWAEARSHFEQVVRIAPANAEAYNNLGVACEQAGDIAAAMDSFRRALEIRPDHPQARSNLQRLGKLTGDGRPAVEG